MTDTWEHELAEQMARRDLADAEAASTPDGHHELRIYARDLQVKAWGILSTLIDAVNIATMDPDGVFLQDVDMVLDDVRIRANRLMEGYTIDER